MAPNTTLVSRLKPSLSAASSGSLLRQCHPPRGLLSGRSATFVADSAVGAATVVGVFAPLESLRVVESALLLELPQTACVDLPLFFDFDCPSPHHR
jgi:hypothetical protein